MAGLGAASIALAQASSPSPPPGLIRCPDWQRYAPPVTLARAADGQTSARFAARTTPTNAGPGNADGQAEGQAEGQAGAQSSRAAACSHRTIKGDTLGRIAARHLGSARRWPEIVRLNPGVTPKALRIGQVLTLPCGLPPNTSPNTSPASASAATSPAAGAGPAAGTGFLARLFGGSARSGTGSGTGATTPGTGAGTGQTPQAPASAPPAETPPAGPPLPVWTAKRGEYLADVLRRWGKAAGYTVIIDSTDAWRLGVPLRLRASFEAAVDELVSGLAHGGTPPRVRLYPNAVLRLGGPL